MMSTLQATYFSASSLKAVTFKSHSDLSTTVKLKSFPDPLALFHVLISPFWVTRAEADSSTSSKWSPILIWLPLMDHLLIYGVRDTMSTNRSCLALPARFSVSAFVADLPSFFHACGFPSLVLLFCWIKNFEFGVLIDWISYLLSHYYF